jgi:hypothetical protein
MVAPVTSLPYDEIFASAADFQPETVWSSAAYQAERIVALDCDDRELFDDFFAAFGGSVPRETASVDDAFISATIRAGAGDSDFGLMSLRRNGQPQSVDDVFFGLSFPDCPFECAPSEDGKWMQVWIPGEAPLFAYRDHYCLFRKSRYDWRIKLLTLLYRGSLRLRDDLIFFHASSISLGEQAILIVGNRKAGKSTTALALAARGHAILADSCACYSPSTERLIPFRRPIGIREGPKSRRVGEALSSSAIRSVMRDDSLRVDLETLLPSADYRPGPASAIFFLRGFAEKPRIEPITNGRSELANLRPIYSSFANAPHTRRAFELIRLVSRARLFALWPGDPDQTARSIEEIMS